MKKILLGAVASLTLSACDLDYFPNDSMTSDQMAGNPSSTEYSTDGNYSMFKDVLEYKGSEYSGSTYVRYFFQMSEFRGDNVCLANKTEDPLYNEICYNDLETDLPTSYFWWCAYHIIYGANAVIESQPEGASDEGDRMLGENYFLRAICHLHLSMLYSRPYTFGRDNMGVVLRTSTDTPTTERSTVGAVYDQIRDDLVKAAGLLKDKVRRGDAGYVSYDAAMGLLSRVYLYRGEDDKVIETVNGLLGGASAESKLDPDYARYFENALSSSETLWAVAHEDYEDRGRESVGSMYWTPDQRGVGGWAEMYYSDPLIALYERHPEDIRFTAYCERLNPDETGQLQVRWAVASEGTDFRVNQLYDCFRDDNGYYYEENGSRHYLQAEQEYGRTQFYVTVGGEKTRAYVDVKTESFNTCPAFMCKKFASPTNAAHPLLSSPVMLRWGEVILNRAEAYAKTGNEQGALDDVNALRRRAGLSEEALYTLDNYREAGYSSVLDVVLDERRLELCFEGQRAFDVFRNGRSLDRRFAGVQPWEVVDCDDPRILYRIPYDEISVSGIPQND